MFCNQCGKKIPDNSNVCLYCGSKITRIKDHGIEDIDNVDRTDVSPEPPQDETLAKEQEETMANPYRRTRIVGTELVLVRSLVLSILLILINFFIIDEKYHPTDGIAYSSAILLILPIILAVMWISLKRAQGILVGILGGQLVSVIVFYMGYKELIDTAGFRLRSDSGIVITVFTFVVLFCLGSAVCGCIHFFSKYNLGKITAILSLCSALFSFILAFIMYFWIYGSEDNYFEYIQKFFSENSYSEYMQRVFPQGGYLFQSISMVWLSFIVSLYTIEFFRGAICNKKDKIHVVTSNNMHHVIVPVLQKTAEKEGRKDVQCSIQYDKTQNIYGITVHTDIAVYVNGGRLPKGVMIEYPAGIILSIENEKNQIYLK